MVRGAAAEGPAGRQAQQSSVRSLHLLPGEIMHTFKTVLNETFRTAGAARACREHFPAQHTLSWATAARPGEEGAVEDSDLAGEGQRCAGEGQGFAGEGQRCAGEGQHCAGEGLCP